MTCGSKYLIIQISQKDVSQVEKERNFSSFLLRDLRAMQHWHLNEAMLEEKVVLQTAGTLGVARTGHWEMECPGEQLGFRATNVGSWAVIVTAILVQDCWFHHFLSYMFLSALCTTLS